jgi:hypothetical protein
VLTYPAAFYKIVLGANESEKLKKTLKMLAFVECAEGDPDMAPLVGDCSEEFFKLVRDKLLFPLHIGTCKVGGLFSLSVSQSSQMNCKYTYSIY